MNKLRILLNGAEVETVNLESGKSYVAGRSSGCDIQLGEYPGISRQHFRVFEQNGQWTVEVTSKLGSVLHNQEPVSELVLTDGMSFKVSKYEFFFAEAQEQKLQQASGDESSFVAAANPPAVMNNFTPANNYEEESGDDYGATMVAQVSNLPYIRIVKDSEGTEETLRLEGTLWLAGRDETCDITLDDVKSSRRHFELNSVGGDYFIRDLGSSNGTLLNGSKLRTDELTPIKSGDVIGVGTTTLHFEIRDPNFKNKLIVLPQQLTQLPPGAEYGNVLSFPGHTQGGVVQLDANGQPMRKKKGLDFSNPRTKIFATVAAVLIIIAFIFGGESESGKPSSPTANDTKKMAFEKLPEPQKKLVRDTYQMAYNLYLNQKSELSAQQLEKIHLILPEGYEESFKLREEIRQREEDRLRRIAIAEEQRRIDENRRKVETSIANCQPIARSASTVTRVQECLAEAMTLDPENQQMQNMLAQVEDRLQTERLRMANKADYARNLARGRSLFQKADKLETSGDLLGAITAWEKMLNASFPDPDGLKDQGRERLLKLKAGLDKEIEKRLDNVEKMYAAGKNREAFAELKKAKAVAPNDSRIPELTDRIVRELNGQLQSIYSDSVLEEGLGNVETAKEKWRKILEIDRPEGEYYRRAQSKLRQYGSGK
jgi:pSer/pThr/pTyr-binding forkhead associated (FHA) protein/tetratricopeptide (TPR) repeat protein